MKTGVQRVTIFGAGGRVGRRLVAVALERGYRVTAFVHHAADFPAHDRLRVIEGDIYNQADVERAVEGSTSVLSALGSWGTINKDILTIGMQHIIPAMEQSGITRIISLTGADARAPGDTLELAHRLTYPLLKFVMGKILTDGERHIQLLTSSSLDWTVLRSPVMRNFGTINYHVSTRRPLPWRTISYDAVAVAMIDTLENQTCSKQAVYVS